MERKQSFESDSTSKKTLEDLEENEDLSNDESDEGALPSPDGEFDDAGELKDADPV